MSPSAIVLAIVLAIVTLGAIAYWDESREAKSALDDFAHEQITVASGLASTLELRGRTQLAPVNLDLSMLRMAFDPIAEPDTVALVRGPGRRAFLATTARELPVADLEAGEEACELDGTDRDACFRRIRGEQAEALGLPPRTAMAGLSGFVDVDGGHWRVVVVSSAHRERDREKRAQWRLVLGFLLSSGLVLAFGTLALRKQKSEFLLARELAVKEAVRERDERLVRADKLATLGALATGIAHEVSTPLGVILGRAEQLAPRVADDERARRAVQVIAEQTDRIGKVVRAFLNLARGGAPSLERTAPAALARVAVDLVEHRFQRAGVLLALDAPDDLPWVACDTRLMEQALVNLLLNACDACQPGGRVMATVSATSEGRVAFAVEDDGVGIAPEDARRATEPFFTTKPEGKGTGLGLAITTEIVQHHQGKLTISPRGDARGTLARIELPAAPRENG